MTKIRSVKAYLLAWTKAGEDAARMGVRRATLLKELKELSLRPESNEHRAVIGAYDAECRYRAAITGANQRARAKLIAGLKRSH